MSWFDTSGFASLAKTALKEAQKSIDKVLDIKDDENTQPVAATPVDSNNDDFFSSWGINQSGSVKSTNSTVTTNSTSSTTNSNIETETSSVITRSPTKTTTKLNNMTTSLWGSFTGSFFETPKGEMSLLEKTVQHTSVESLADDSSDIGSIDEKFSKSKLVVREVSEDGESSIRSRLSSSEIEIDEEKDLSKSLIAEILQPSPLSESAAEISGDNKSSSVSFRSRDRPSSFYSNRLSVISSESGKNSSESVEVLGGTGCTTTPESEVTSAAHSISTSSSKGGKPPSDSVEVLPDSLTSPSSVEIISSEATNSHRLSQVTDEEFMSPFQSPTDHETFKEDDFKLSPESVEIIPEALEEEEQSVADDSISYMSISESTDATVLEPFAFKPENKFEIARSSQKLGKEMAESITSELSLSPDKIGDIPITQAPSRNAMHLPLSHTTMSSSQPTLPTINNNINNNLKESLSHSAQSLINTQPQPSGSAQTLPNLLDSVKIIDIPSMESSSQSLQNIELQNESNDEGSQSDRTLMAENESVGVESGSDEMPNETQSSYLKNMIADAMIEKSPENSSKSNQFLDLSHNMLTSYQSDGTVCSDSISISHLDMPARDQSPISSESRSDLVKIGSEQTSGHTSGDELETTTSSDIEIISSPNGDNSSVQSGSRQSPAKLQKFRCSGDQTSAIEMLFGKSIKSKTKGHNRELSETSSHSDDSSEIDRLLKRVSEMTEILEAREAKLIDTSRRNAELQELNIDLKHQLENILSKQIDSADINLVTEEYTQRLSALERKFQQAIREKDILRKQLEQTKQDAATRMSKGELETLINDKDETIKELRQEGEKLSKQQLQHSNIIKKLRAKEKENESTIKHLKERAEELTSETDRLKRSLTAKDEVERSQIDAVHQLTSKNKKLENETAQLKSQLDDVNQKLETFKKSLEAAKKELSEHTRFNSELQARKHALESLENEKRITQMQNEEVLSQLDDLRQKLRNAEQDHLKKEQALRKENSNLLQRIEDAEARNEELAQSVSQATRPLIRQLETLQATHSMKLNAWETQEQTLLEKLKSIQENLSLITERERSTREECFTLRSNVSSLETKLSNTSHQLELLTTQLEQQKTEYIMIQQELTREKNSFIDQLKQKKNEISDLKNEVAMVKEQLSMEKSLLKTEELKRSQLQEHDPVEPISMFHQDSSPETRTTSPTLSLRRLSFSESLSSSAWHPDDHMETSTSRYSNMFEIEGLQSALKQKEGEVQQLQWELARREKERTYLNTEISNLMVKMENLEQKVQENETLKEQFVDLQQQYDALCQMYGEKVEETQELRLDLEDVKEMYKTQIDELLKQQKNSTSN